MFHLNEIEKRMDLVEQGFTHYRQIRDVCDNM